MAEELALAWWWSSSAGLGALPAVALSLAEEEW
jgi:hypothetical protein